MDPLPDGAGAALVPNPSPPGWRAWLPGSAEVVACGRTGSADLALTFDDGPDPVGTPAVLEALDASAATATFFVLSQAVARHPRLAAEVVARGHEIGLHGDVHERLDRRPIRELVRRLGDAQALVEDVVQSPVTFHRPPFGRLSWRALQACGRLELRVAMWSHDPGDWRQVGAEILPDALRACFTPGAIVLLHDGDPCRSVVTAAALRAAAPDLAAAGLRSARLSDLR